ncbi:hypothetical protein SARC_03225 [Sphaeroforma arctica JP610]|uniref:Apple domain-containing protein n=1 Tax=Sphaeroforma arctica JP610 TaxID=667725 RepID=A0A0L0G6B4_9EUKA|nr:hypothetical protein SARC_03225 [Sphaeroforma arctica JP610]KNC84552.1 hypothetical protein SARC_03225 [Sphaeroforma arctica JP610]|eukprot:XP_014158454.1 hypothetical protein SARC_03225 [Sphaeroforma arctica JP610]
MRLIMLVTFLVVYVCFGSAVLAQDNIPKYKSNDSPEFDTNIDVQHDENTDRVDDRRYVRRQAHASTADAPTDVLDSSSTLNNTLGLNDTLGTNSTLNSTPILNETLETNGTLPANSSAAINITLQSNTELVASSNAAISSSVAVSLAISTTATTFETTTLVSSATVNTTSTSSANVNSTATQSVAVKAATVNTLTAPTNSLATTVLPHILDETTTATPAFTQPAAVISETTEAVPLVPVVVPTTFEERTIYYGDLLTTVNYFEVANYTSHFELLSVQNYDDTTPVLELMGAVLAVPAGSPDYVTPMQVYADACGAFCTNHTGGCNGFGIRFVEQSQDNVCVLLNYTLLYAMEGFSCDALCPSGNGIMMNIFYPNLPACTSSDFFGWQNAGELQTNLLDHGCNPYLAIGEKCSSIFASWVQVPGIDLTGCPVNSTCADGRIPYAKSCETDDSLEDYINAAIYQEELRQNFSTDYANGLYDQMLGMGEWTGKVIPPVGYSMPLPDTLLSLTQQQYDLTWPLPSVPGENAIDNINDYSQACALQCSANTTCIGFTVVYIPNDPRNQCRFVPNDAVPPGKSWEFTALRCSTSDPCPSGNNIPMRLYIPDSYSHCGEDMFLGYDLGLYNQIKNYNCHNQLVIGADCGIDGPQTDVTNYNAGCKDRMKCTNYSPYYKCQLELYNPFNDAASISNLVGDIVVPNKKVSFLATFPLTREGTVVTVGAQADSTVYSNYGDCARACAAAPPCEIFQLTVATRQCDLTPYTYDEYIELPPGNGTGTLEVLTGQLYPLFNPVGIATAVDD